MSIFQEALARSDGKTLILTNGSKWGGEAPSAVQALIDVLAKEVLDPCFEEFHCYRPVVFSPIKGQGSNDSITRPWRGAAAFSGNFITVSHSFYIITKDEDVVKALTEAIEKNMATDEYQKLAYDSFTGWYYAKTCEGDRLLPPKVAEDVRRGASAITELRYPRNYAVMKTAVLGGPRFADPISQAS
jgi:CRISPR/Cas system Type II protein with McrA/HNH and RuvC-like nuclease domain